MVPNCKSVIRPRIRGNNYFSGSKFSRGDGRLESKTPINFLDFFKGSIFTPAVGPQDRFHFRVIGARLGDQFDRRFLRLVGHKTSTYHRGIEHRIMTYWNDAAGNELPVTIGSPRWRTQLAFSQNDASSPECDCMRVYRHPVNDNFIPTVSIQYLQPISIYGRLHGNCCCAVGRGSPALAMMGVHLPLRRSARRYQELGS